MRWFCPYYNEVSLKQGLTSPRVVCNSGIEISCLNCWSIKQDKKRTVSIVPILNKN